METDAEPGFDGTSQDSDRVLLRSRLLPAACCPPPTARRLLPAAYCQRCQRFIASSHGRTLSDDGAGVEFGQ